MHKLDDLKYMLCEELEEYATKDKLDMGALDAVDKLAHAVKNLDKIISEDEYSNEYRSGRSMNYGGGRSYARRRDNRGRYMSNRYSGDIAEDIRGMMDDAPNEQTKREMMKLVEHLERV